MIPEPNSTSSSRDERTKVGEIELHIRGEGETVVLIHGWPDSLNLWDAQVEALSCAYRCVRFTLPGYDRSHTRRMYDLEDLMVMIKQVVETVGQGRPVTLLLHDWGCIWGYQYYLRNPQTVGRIIGVDVGDAGSPELLAELSGRDKGFMLAYQLWLALAWKLGGRIGDGMTRRMARIAKAPAPLERIHSGMNYSYYFVWSRRLLRRPTGMIPVRIECPLLFIYGTKKPGRFHSRAWEESVRKQPGNRVEALPTGHWVMVQSPERFNALVMEWLQSNPSPFIKENNP